MGEFGQKERLLFLTGLVFMIDDKIKVNFNSRLQIFDVFIKNALDQRKFFQVPLEYMQITEDDEIMEKLAIYAITPYEKVG